MLYLIKYYRIIFIKKHYLIIYYKCFKTYFQKKFNLIIEIIKSYHTDLTSFSLKRIGKSDEKNFNVSCAHLGVWND